MDSISLPYVLCRIEDDSSVTPVSEHPDIVEGIAAGQYTVDHEDFDFAYALHTDDGVRVASFAEGRMGYREWAYRTGRLEFISSEDDRYLRDEDEWVS